MNPKPYIGRFAPSPTGPLHLGSLATALGSYLDARIHAGQWLLRIEDIDEQRCSTDSVRHILIALQAHGLVWDQAPWVQSKRYSVYQHNLDVLSDQKLCYPCCCTRKEIENAQTKRQMGQTLIYPGTCAHGMPAGRHARAIRFRCPTQPVEWSDHSHGPQREQLALTSGDFVLLRADGFWAYHLAVVSDDAASQITHIVRGDDLLDTTGRQIALYRALNQTPPAYWHLPVILAADGQKLSKQTGAQALELNKPLDNLNTVWTHFGQELIRTATVNEWLNRAAPAWANYRERSRFAA